VIDSMNLISVTSSWIYQGMLISTRSIVILILVFALIGLVILFFSLYQFRYFTQNYIARSHNRSALADS